MLIAITRSVSPLLADCELTHLSRQPIDVARAMHQHEEYEKLLVTLGVHVVRAADAPEFPDSVFIEDTAIVLDEVAIMTRPGAEVRRGEVSPVANTLEAFRPTVQMAGAGTLDGGDVIRMGRQLYVGRSSRTNDAGIDEFRRLVDPYGYRVTGVDFSGCLHLKSAATAVSDNTVLFNPRWVSDTAFNRAMMIPVNDAEPDAGNALRVADTLVYSMLYPRTGEHLERNGFRVATVDVSELAKAEGAVTCCSLLFNEITHVS